LLNYKASETPITPKKSTSPIPPDEFYDDLATADKLAMKNKDILKNTDTDYIADIKKQRGVKREVLE
jgi:hypothetical protein